MFALPRMEQQAESIMWEHNKLGSRLRARVIRDNRLPLFSVSSIRKWLVATRRLRGFACDDSTQNCAESGSATRHGRPTPSPTRTPKWAFAGLNRPLLEHSCLKECTNLYGSSRNALRAEPGFERHTASDGKRRHKRRKGELRYAKGFEQDLQACFGHDKHLPFDLVSRRKMAKGG